MFQGIEYNRLIKEVIGAVSDYGPVRIANLLHSIRVHEFEFENDHVKQVVELVASAFGLTVQEVMVGNGRKNERTVAQGFCVYYLRYHYGYEVDHIKYMLYMHERSCYVYCKNVQKLHPSNASDRRFLQIKTLLDQQMPALKTDPTDNNQEEENYN